jgi:hypothetical protein
MGLWFLAWFMLWPIRWRRHVPPKCRLTFNGLQDVIFQENELFVTAAVRTSILHIDINSYVDSSVLTYIIVSPNRLKVPITFIIGFFPLDLQPLGPWPLIFSFMIILQTVGPLERVISSLEGLYLNTGQHKHRINAHTYQISMPCVGFEPTTPASERAKTVHALDRSVTVTGL